ncbi:MAG TPA: hypothetical protein QGI72_02180 [Poseidonia sp.]|nr:hypothetical protein [Poseidonia sp.]
MTDYPPAWYGLWFLVALFGVTTWYLRNFTERIQGTRIAALLGTASMLTLLAWTWSDF